MNRAYVSFGERRRSHQGNAARHDPQVADVVNRIKSGDVVITSPFEGMYRPLDDDERRELFDFAETYRKNFRR